LVVIKKDKEADFWIRITKDKKTQTNIVFDWDKYVDADEEAEEGKYFKIITFNQNYLGNKGLDGGWDPS